MILYTDKNIVFTSYFINEISPQNSFRDCILITDARYLTAKLIVHKVDDKMNKSGPSCSIVADIYGSCLRHLILVGRQDPRVAPFAFAQGFTPGYKSLVPTALSVGSNDFFAGTNRYGSCMQDWQAYGTYWRVRKLKN